jgi:hypothetical protein
VLEPIYSSITFEADRGKRTGSVTVAGVGQARVEPLRNPVTGEEHRARINLPDGFEYKIAEVANTVSLSVTSPEILRMEHSNCHAHLCEIEWSN